MADEGGHQKVLTCSQSMKKRQSVADEGGNQWLMREAIRRCSPAPSR